MPEKKFLAVILEETEGFAFTGTFGGGGFVLRKTVQAPLEPVWVDGRFCRDELSAYGFIRRAIEAAGSGLSGIGISTAFTDGTFVTSDNLPIGRFTATPHLPNPLLKQASHYWPGAALFYRYLCGHAVMDSSSAGETGWTKHGTWNPGLLKKAGLTRKLMPNILSAGERLPHNCFVVPSAIACACSVLPQRKPRRTLLIDCSETAVLSKGFKASIAIPGLRLVNRLIRRWSDADGTPFSWSEIDVGMMITQSCQGVINPADPRFLSTADPEAEIRKFFRETNQRNPSNRFAVLRLVYDSIACSFRQTAGNDFAHVFLTGAGAENHHLCQAISDVMNLPVYAGPVHASALGSVLVQSVGAGIFASYQDGLSAIKNNTNRILYKPVAPALWDDAFIRYASLIQKGHS